jgi:hypothetical protein
MGDNNKFRRLATAVIWSALLVLMLLVIVLLCSMLVSGIVAALRGIAW